MNTPKIPLGPPPQPAPSTHTTDPKDPRETMRVLPRYLQPWLTAITGKALPDEQPRLQWTGAGRFWQVVLGTLAGLAGSILAWQAGGGWLVWLPLTWLITVWGLRSIQVTILHHASHDTLFKNARLGAQVSEWLSTLIWILPFQAYRRGHLPHHSATATSRDVDLLFLKKLGFKPGLTVQQYWRQLAWMLFSPGFHARYLSARLRANFVEATGSRRALAYAWALTVVVLGVLMPGPMVIAFLIPVIPLYQASGLLQLLTEHSWVRIGERVNRPKHILSRVTTGRFMGRAVPEAVRRGGRSLWLWIVLAGWILQMLFQHLPARVFVVQGDLPNHDFHHRKPGSEAWANASFARRDDAVSTGETGWLPYDEVWGLGAALNLTFTRLSRLPSNAVLGEPLTYGEVADELLTM